MSPANWIALAAILATVALSVWQAMRTQAKSDAKAQWAKIQELEREVSSLKTQVAVLRKALEAMPTRDDLHDRLQSLEHRIDNRLTVLGKELQEALLAVLKRTPAGAP